MKKWIFILTIFCLVMPGLFAAPTVMDIMKKIEESQNLTSDMTAKVKITRQVVDQGVKVSESVMYRQDSDDSMLLVMIAPDNEKGNGYLKAGDNFWMYKRNTRTFQHINRDESISGSNARAGDFERKKFTELYAPFLDENGKEIISEEKLGKLSVYKIKIKAIEKDVTYPIQTLYVKKNDYLTMKSESYSLSGTLMNTTYYLKYTKISGRYFPLKQIFIDEFEKGNKSVLEISGISLKTISDNIFTKAYLENLSK